MQYTTQSTVTLPVNVVNRDIEKHIVQHRCKLEMVFLKENCSSGPDWKDLP
jgi:acyl-CoA hydrolase